MSRRITTAFAALATCAILAACSTGGARPTPTAVPAVTIDQAASRGSYGVGVTTLELVDSTRPTVANRDAPGTPDRRIAVEVWYPAAASATAPEQRDAPIESSARPYPLIIFAHGFAAFRRQSAVFTQHLASHGYIVASPDFPQTRNDAPGGPRLWGVLDQPADVSFVIDQLLARSASSGGVLSGAIDPDRIGMTGHSLGGLTTMLTAFGSMRDPRIKAVAPVSPIGCLLPVTLEQAPIPVMVINGTRERVVDPATSQVAYDAASPPKYHVQIIGADHARFADVDITDDSLGDVVNRLSNGDLIADAVKVAQSDGADVLKCTQRTTTTDELVSGPRQRELLNTVALPFFDAYLRGDEAAARFLHDTLPTLEGIRLDSAGVP